MIYHDLRKNCGRGSWVPQTSKFLVFAVLAISYLIGACPSPSAAQVPKLGDLDLNFGAAATGERVTISARIVAAQDGKPSQLQITARMLPGWHIYSITQKKGGPKPSRINLDNSDQFRLLGAFVANQAAAVHRFEFWPGLDVEEHENTVTWSAAIEPVGPRGLAGLTISGNVAGQVCKDQCVDFSEAFEARLDQATSSDNEFASPVSDNQTGPQNPGLPFAAGATAFGNTTFSKGSITVAGHLSRAVSVPGETVNLTIRVTPKNRFHVYELSFRPPAADATGLPTLIVLNQRSGLLAAAPLADRPVVEHVTPEANNHVDRFYDGSVSFTVPLLIPAGTVPGSYPVSGYMGFHACSVDELGKPATCETPTAVRFLASIPVGQVGQDGAIPLQLVSASYNDVVQQLQLAPAWDGPSGAVNALPMAAAAGAIDWQSVGGYIVWAFLGGLILNVMPCVLPVIGIKIMSFVQQAGEDRRTVFMLNLWYVLGLISVFLVLAALAAFANLRWAEQFERPEVVIVLASIVFVFALSLLGVWEIPIPGFVGSGKAAAASAKEGPAGAFSKGVLTTILATPCTGPFMGAALAWAVRQPTPVIFAIFFSMGLGMASPYLLIGAFPHLIRFLPKPGLWMETFKNIMGFVMLGTVAWVFSIIAEEYQAATLGLLFSLWAACWWFGRTPLTAELGRRVVAGLGAVAVAIVFGAASFALLVPGEQWEPYSADRLSDYQRSGVTVLIDFTAKSCLICQLNKKTALYTDATKSYMVKNGVEGLTADLSEDAPHIDKLMTELGRDGGGIPFYAIFPGDGRPPITFDGPLSQGGLLEKLGEAGPSQRNSHTAMSSRPTN